MHQAERTFAAWKETVSESIRSERFWALLAYQKGLFLYDLLWEDAQRWLEDTRGQPIARQIIASADSICSNIEEGFGRGYGRQLVLFYVYALGSARETKGRIYRASAFYPLPMQEMRLALASEVVALILTEINRQKRY